MRGRYALKPIIAVRREKRGTRSSVLEPGGTS
jgi:hypothetical protein